MDFGRGLLRLLRGPERQRGRGAAEQVGHDIDAELAQFFQARQLMPQPKDARSLKSILSEANKGQKADQAEVNAAVTKGTQYFIPFMVFFISLRLAASLPLYWLSSSAVAYVQQSRLLREDTAEADANVPEQKPKIKKPQPKKQHQGRRRRH